MDKAMCSAFYKTTSNFINTYKMSDNNENTNNNEALHIGSVIARLESLQRFDVGAWPDGCPSSDKDDDGDWICFDDVKEIIDELKANAL